MVKPLRLCDEVEKIKLVFESLDFIGFSPTGHPDHPSGCALLVAGHFGEQRIFFQFDSLSGQTKQPPVLPSPSSFGLSLQTSSSPSLRKGHYRKGVLATNTCRIKWIKPRHILLKVLLPQGSNVLAMLLGSKTAKICGEWQVTSAKLAVLSVTRFVVW